LHARRRRAQGPAFLMSGYRMSGYWKLYFTPRV
jgi:hypothetical protein